MELDISLQCLQVSLLIITLNQLNPVHALPTLSLKTILILFSVCVFQVVTLFKFHKKLSVVLLSHTAPATSLIPFGLMKIIIFCES